MAKPSAPYKPPEAPKPEVELSDLVMRRDGKGGYDLVEVTVRAPPVSEKVLERGLQLVAARRTFKTWKARHGGINRGML